MNSEESNDDFEVAENELDILSMLIGDDEEKWRNTRGQIELINQSIQKGERPIDILKNYFKMNVNHLPEDPLEQWTIILHLIMEGPHRKRLEDVNTFQQACDLIKNKQNIMVLTGAGISVPCGVPDFRSRNGIYARLAVDFPDLDEPQSMFDINYFCKNPRPFFKFAKEIYPGRFTPSAGHRFIKLLEDKNKLLRNYTQNIDTLEQVAGIKNIIQCHGSFANATCMRCEHKVKGSDIEEDVMNQTIPLCKMCINENETNFESFVNDNTNEDSDTLNCKLPIMKPDVVFFGEGLPRDFHATLADDKDKTDLLIVIGSSLKVRPVAHVPGCLPSNVPQILINKEPLSNHTFDVELLGDCDAIVRELCRQLNWVDEDLTSAGEFTEKTIFEFNSTIEDNDSDIEKKDDKEVKENEVIERGEHFVNVSDLLNEEVTCIRVPPNRYIFKGADYVINMNDIEGHVIDHVQFESYSSEESSDEDAASDKEMSQNNDNNSKQSTECTDPKRRKLSSEETP